MKKRIALLVLILNLLAATLHVQPARAANAVVGTGTPASCTEAAFDSALTTASSGGGTITFNCGSGTHTITFSVSKTVTLGNVTIDGGNTIILAGVSTVRQFFVGGGVTFTLKNIILRDGDSLVGGGAIEASTATVILESVQFLNNYSSVQGGAIYCFDGTVTASNTLFDGNESNTGGAIFNDGCNITISNSTFQNNKAVASGGTIYNSTIGVLQISNSQFTGNQALDGGGIFNASGATATLNSVTLSANSGGHGGGVENSGTMTINDSIIDANTVTGSGGGIWNMGGALTLARTTLNNNRAYEGAGINSYGTQVQITNVNITNNVTTGTHGGGIFINAGTVSVTNATISGNRAVGAAADGGGIYHNSNDNLTLTNVTLASNQAGARGGGLYHYGNYAILTNVTIGNNTAVMAGPAIYEDSPNTAVVQMKNSVVFGSAGNCDGGLFQSFGYNISKGSCPSLNQATDQDNFAGDIAMGALAFNGGLFPMQTMMPLTGSPVIDAGNTCPATDQLGAARPVGAGCDIGAVEFGASTSTFADVPSSYWAWQFIERLYAAGITGGCSTSPLNYCPESGVTRAQMAIFLLKGIHGSSYVPPAVGAGTGFNDVLTSYWAAAWIKQLAAEGITSGCGGGNYCPDATVTRAQMAIFLLRAEHGSAYIPPAATGIFTDVPVGYWADAWIEQLAAEGITSGCGTGIYCPESNVTRAQMAVFLVRTFKLP